MMPARKHIHTRTHAHTDPNTVALWQDATELAAYSMHKDTVSFSTNVSARWEEVVMSEAWMVVSGVMGIRG